MGAKGHPRLHEQFSREGGMFRQTLVPVVWTWSRSGKKWRSFTIPMHVALRRTRMRGGRGGGRREYGPLHRRVLKFIPSFQLGMQYVMYMSGRGFLELLASPRCLSLKSNRMHCLEDAIAKTQTSRCRPCHGQNGAPRSTAHTSMAPEASSSEERG